MSNLPEDLAFDHLFGQLLMTPADAFVFAGVGRSRHLDSIAYHYREAQQQLADFERDHGTCVIMWARHVALRKFFL